MQTSNTLIEKFKKRCGSGRAVLLLVAAVWLTCGTWLGCTAERRYRVLSFFFDGVPDPNAPPGALSTDETTAGGRPVIRAVVYTHKPFAENKCDACHVGSTGEFESFEKLNATICLKCHQNVPTQYPVMHGPVAAVECTWCHVPHESAIPHLLKAPAPAVCVQCHDRELLPAKPAEHFMADKSCLDCHFAHGGQEHGLLREGVALTSESAGSSTTAPATRPGAAATTAPATTVPAATQRSRP